MKSTSGRRRKARTRRPATRPEFVTLAALLVVASVVAGFLALTRPDSTTPTASAGSKGDTAGAASKTTKEPPWDGKTHVLGDGSTSYTGPQKDQLKPVPLKPGEKPPQFVVFSWDGALEGDEHQFSHYREMAKEYNAHMTFFLTGIYLLPKGKKTLYHPPQNPPGAAAIDYATDQHIRDTLEQLRFAYDDGNEIGTHFNGHFCDTKTSGKYWSVDDWKQEIDQFYNIVENWKTNTGYKDIPPLPFDFKKEVVGGRAPCLEGQPNLLKAIKDYGYRYDASSPGDLEIWPKKVNGIWNFPLEMLPYPGGKYQGLSMDFNFLYNQSNGEVHGDPAKYPEWEQQTIDSYMAGFNRVYYGSRAPLFIGNHFEDWNGGIYMKAIDKIIPQICTKKGVKCVSFKELADWMDVQKPSTLQALRGLDPAQSPDWSTVVK
jgi:peptidoglycan/xylan/chitin deacetylase (PgdA/CDA1 family)